MTPTVRVGSTRPGSGGTAASYGPDGEARSTIDSKLRGKMGSVKARLEEKIRD